MNMNTIMQELHKKIKRMDRKAFNNFILKLEKIYMDTHGQNSDDLTWPECNPNTQW